MKLILKKGEYSTYPVPPLLNSELQIQLAEVFKDGRLLVFN
jgi:hypothetical protein